MSILWSGQGFLVPYESSLTPEDCYWSAKLACLEMIKSGTTAFAESGSTHMGDVANAVIESGMRAALARSTMDIGDAIPDCHEGKFRIEYSSYRSAV